MHQQTLLEDPLEIKEEEEVDLVQEEAETTQMVDQIEAVVLEAGVIEVDHQMPSQLVKFVAGMATQLLTVITGTMSLIWGKIRIQLDQHKMVVMQPSLLHQKS